MCDTVTFLVYFRFIIKTQKITYFMAAMTLITREQRLNITQNYSISRNYIAVYILVPSVAILM